MRLAIMMLLLLAGCNDAPPSHERLDRPAAQLPTAETLPVGLRGGCDCVMRDQCPVADEISGWSEVRNINCAWTTDNVASCQWDERFVADNGDDRIEPGPWHRNAGDFQALSGGGFCAQ